TDTPSLLKSLSVWRIQSRYGCAPVIVTAVRFTTRIGRLYARWPHPTKEPWRHGDTETRSWTPLPRCRASHVRPTAPAATRTNESRETAVRRAPCARGGGYRLRVVFSVPRCLCGFPHTTRTLATGALASRAAAAMLCASVFAAG